MAEHVRVQQTGFVEQKHRMHLVAPQLLHVGPHRQEEVGGHGCRVQPERVAKMAVEVVPAKDRVAGLPEQELRSRPPRLPENSISSAPDWLRAAT